MERSNKRKSWVFVYKLLVKTTLKLSDFFPLFVDGVQFTVLPFHRFTEYSSLAPQNIAVDRNKQ